MSESRKAAIIGIGAYAPERVMTNDEVATFVETNDEWIRTRTGISERRIAAPDEPSSAMGAKAAQAAMENAGVSPEEIDLLIVATITPDYMAASTACVMQGKLGLAKATCFDLNAACSGFIYALDTGRAYIQSGLAKKVLVVGADKMSSIVNWKDRGTCILFGDAAGAVVLAESSGPDVGILSSATGGDGSQHMLINIPAGGSAMPASAESVADCMHSLRMDGNSVFKLAVRGMVAISATALERAGIAISDINCIIPHQANLRIIQSIVDKLHYNMEQVVINLDKYGNTTAATIPLAMLEAVQTGRIKDGDLVLLVAFGAGLTWGATVIRWGK